MELPLVVGIDGSDSSLLAVDWAVDEAARHGLSLRLVHASMWERYERARPSFTTGRPAGEALAQHIVASCAERARLRDPEVKVSADAVAADAVSTLLRAGSEAFALVTGVHGRGEVAGLLLGSVSLTVAARAMCPVIVVRGQERNLRGSFGRVVVGVGDSTGGTGAVRFAAREAEARGSSLIAVRAWHSPVHEPGAPLAESVPGDPGSRRTPPRYRRSRSRPPSTTRCARSCGSAPGSMPAAARSRAPPIVSCWRHRRMPT